MLSDINNVLAKNLRDLREMYANLEEEFADQRDEHRRQAREHRLSVLEIHMLRRT
jgi:hypothetical protein